MRPNNFNCENRPQADSLGRRSPVEFPLSESIRLVLADETALVLGERDHNPDCHTGTQVYGGVRGGIRWNRHEERIYTSETIA